MAKTKEEKNEYTKEWRIRNRDIYLKRRRLLYQKNIDKYREKSKERSRAYYYEVHSKRRKENPEFWSQVERARAKNKKEKKNLHLKELREKLGGKCSICGYCEHVEILQFHHHGKNKYKNVSEIPNYEKRENEAKKCILLCPNCHAIETLKERNAKNQKMDLQIYIETNSLEL